MEEENQHINASGSSDIADQEKMEKHYKKNGSSAEHTFKKEKESEEQMFKNMFNGVVANAWTGSVQ